ncbi:MAG: response regulator transcription factor [Spirochaetales bacterium]|nr:response regulator transcription factor [Spirochaetales bacterium]
MNIRIILADDHSMFRGGLKALVEKESGLEVIAEASTGMEAIQLVQEHSPEMVVMDVAMPILNGIEATRRLVAENPGLKIIALSMHSDRRFVIEMLRAGAKGFVLKHSAFEELVIAIGKVSKGNTYLSSGIVDVVVNDYVRNLAGTDSPAYNQLTNRERQVLKLLAEGKSVKEIGFVLNVSGKTVETHRINLKEKLGIESLAELTKFAIREGITTLDS